MRVHITLKPVVLADHDAKSSALRQLASHGLCDIDESRFRRFGVASGTVDEAHLADLERLDVVATVEADREATIASRD